MSLKAHSPEDRSPQMVQMCLLSDSDVPEGCAGTFITPLMPSGGLMSSVLLTEFIGEFSWNIETQTHVDRSQNSPHLITGSIIHPITQGIPHCSAALG